MIRPRPKPLLLVLLAVLAVVGTPASAPWRTLPGWLAASAAALVIDAPLLRWRTGRWQFPRGGLITAWLVALVLSPYEPAWVAATAVGVGLVSKHLARRGRVNVANPAAVGLVAVSVLTGAAENWWGALADVPPVAGWGLVLGVSVVVAERVHKLPLALAFLGAFGATCTAATFVVAPDHLAEVFVAPDLLALIFFAGVMLTDPPTSPVALAAQVWHGLAVGLVAAALLLGTTLTAPWLWGLLAGNLLEAWRRWRVDVATRRGHAVPRYS